MGVDLSQYDLDEPLGNIESNAIQSAAANLSAATGQDGTAWTVRDIARQTAIGGLGPVEIGSGATIADRLQEIQEQTDVDGFNLAYAVTPGTWEDVIEFVVPELRARGAYPTSYTPGSLREKLHGRGDRLPAEHRGASFRVVPSGVGAGAS
jgi:long-chain alkane monooxygenase